MSVVKTLKCTLAVTQGHWKWYYSKAWVQLPIRMPCSNYGRIFSLAVSTQYTNVTDTQPDTAWLQKPRYAISLGCGRAAKTDVENAICVVKAFRITLTPKKLQMKTNGIG